MLEMPFISQIHEIIYQDMEIFYCGQRRLAWSVDQANKLIIYLQLDLWEEFTRAC